VRTLSGFSLIEFLTYIAIVSFVGVVFFSGLANNLVGSVRAEHDLQKLIAEHTATDLLRRDLSEAHFERTHWMVAEDQWIWSLASQQVGWSFELGVLYRTIGDYDFEQKRWAAKKKSQIVRDLKRFELALEGNPATIAHVQYIFETAKELVTGFVALHNKVLV